MLKNHSYKTVIFDLGNVLISWNPQKAVDILLKEDPSFNKEVQKIVQTPFWHLFDLGYITIPDLISHFSKDYSEKHLQQFLHKVMEFLLPIDFGLQILNQVQKKGVQTLILSNISQEFHNWINEKHPFLTTFSGGIFSYKVNALKPDFKIYKLLLEKYNLNPKDCLFIDDLESNVYSAKKMGINSVVFQENEEFLEQLRSLKVI